MEAHGALFCQAATQTSHYFWHSGEAQTRELQGWEKALVGMSQSTLKEAGCKQHGYNHCLQKAWCPWSRFIHLCMATSYQHSQKLQAQKTLVFTLDKRATTKLFKQLQKATKTSLWRPAWFNISLYYSFQHNRCLSWHFSLVLDFISADKIRKCFALENITHMPELESPWELSRPGGIFVAVTETIIPPAQVFQQKSTQVLMHKGSEVLNSVSRCGEARKWGFKSKDWNPYS